MSCRVRLGIYLVGYGEGRKKKRRGERQREREREEKGKREKRDRKERQKLPLPRRRWKRRDSAANKKEDLPASADGGGSVRGLSLGETGQAITHTVPGGIAGT